MVAQPGWNGKKSETPCIFGFAILAPGFLQVILFYYLPVSTRNFGVDMG
jgi:hypothetical protein